MKEGGGVLSVPVYRYIIHPLRGYPYRRFGFEKAEDVPH
jgi:hypothetical protein